MTEAPVFEVLRFIRMASLTIILAAAAVIVVAIAIDSLRSIRAKHEQRKREYEREIEQYRRMFEVKGEKK